MGAFKIPVTRSAYVIVLRSDLKSPLAPQSDEEKVTPPASSSDKSAAPNAPKNPADADECKPEGEAKTSAGSPPEKVEKGRDKDAGGKKDEKDAKVPKRLWT